MANYVNGLCFLLMITFLTTLKVEAARESKYFSKFNPQVDQPEFKPSLENKNYNGFHFENPESDIPPEEFIENIKNDPSAFSRDFDEDSNYVTTVPQSYKEKDSNDFFYPNKLNPAEDMHNADAGFELTDEEDKFFNKKEGKKNSYNTYNYNDRENVDATEEAQGRMSDTRTLENGKYYYNPRVVVKGNSGSQRSNDYFGNKDDKEFRPLKDFEYNPQNQAGFVP